jgi:hypothetical protein
MAKSNIDQRMTPDTSLRDLLAGIGCLLFLD